ncbi:MAG: hypothetical protein IJ064_03355 [Bacteroidaceae bacterium]|nr:hypothetical protein [Bacteroidaceae bacterium]
MKKATLMGLVGSIIILLIQVYYFIGSFSVIQYGGGIVHVVTNLLGIAAWCCIAYFFFTLYKKQK